MSSSDSIGVRYEIHGGTTAVVTLDRPEKRNAVSAAMTAAIGTFLQRTEDDSAIRAVVFTSSSDVFCAGADLAELAQGHADRLRTPEGGFAGIVFKQHTKPWIAAVTGPALAGGCEIALACDIILAAPGARFGLPEVCRGLIAGAGGAYRLPRRIPEGIAIEMLVTGTPIAAAEAYRVGLVNRIIDYEALLTDALAVAERIAGNAPLAIAESLAIIRSTRAEPEDRQRLISREASDRLVASSDAKEGSRAFLEKRRPQWQGC